MLLFLFYSKHVQQLMLIFYLGKKYSVSRNIISMNSGIKYFLLVGYCIMIAFTTAGQENITVKGIIYDLQSRQPLEGAHVEADDRASAWSNASGYFELNTGKRKA